MTHQEPAIEAIDADAAREQWDAVLERVRSHETRFLIQCDGKPVAAVISACDLELFERYLRRRAEQFKAIDEIRAAFEDVPDDEIEREVAKAIAEVRAENRERERVNSVAAS